MRAICRISFSALLVLALFSCENRQISPLFDNIETFIQERPDSALVILESISEGDLNTRELQARHSLLYATALDKNYIDTTDLSIILPASDYYSKHGPSSSKMRALFYQGCIHANRGEDDRAMHYYLLALEDSAKVSDNHYKELINSAISDIFSRNNNEEQELFYVTEALKYGHLAGDSIGVWAITGHLASCYANSRQWDDAVKAYDSFFAMPVYDFNTYYRRRISYAKDLIRMPEPNSSKCIDIIEEIAINHPDLMSVEAYCIYAYAHQLEGNSSVADEVIRQLTEIKKQQDVVQLWRYRIYREQGRYRQALEDLEQSVLVQDSLVLTALRQSLIRSQRDYLQAETTVLKKENEIEKQRIAVIILLSIILLGVLIMLYLKRMAVYDKRIEELSALQHESQQMLDLQNAQAASMNAQLAEKEMALLQLRKQFATIYKAQYKTLNNLCAAYLSPIKKDRKDVLYDEAMRQLDVIVNDKESQNRFMSLVNGSLDNIIDKLRKDLPNHKEQDFRFLMYVIAGFDATTISNLTGYSVGTVYTKKNRLKVEISQLSSPYKNFYLDFIE